MQAEVRYLPPHRIEGGTLENVAGKRPNATRTTTPQRIFAHTNPITQPRVYEGGFSFNGGPGGHHATTCRSKWQLGTTSSPGSSTSSSTVVCATSCNAIFRGNQRGSIGIIWARPSENWPLEVLQTLSRDDR